MAHDEILTKNLRLTVPSLAAVLESIEAMSESDRAQVSPEWLARARAATSPDPWIHGFEIVHPASGATVGSCGFKGPPSAEGVVEIAYGVNPAYQRRGFATEAARALVEYALRSGVSLVRAHTLPHENASTRVLTKCGFDCVGEVMDPEDGRVWRWELSAG
jgi:RimJ/RimL family protein N-acetyltransferase